MPSLGTQLQRVGATEALPRFSIDDIKGSDEPDNYASRLLKYIPAEVIALYITLDGIIRGAGNQTEILLWIALGIGVVGTYFYLMRVARVSKQTQLLISTAAFAVWVFALGGPFELQAWYKPLYGSLLLPVYTFAIAIIEA